MTNATNPPPPGPHALRLSVLRNLIWRIWGHADQRRQHHKAHHDDIDELARRCIAAYEGTPLALGERLARLLPSRPDAGATTSEVKPSSQDAAGSPADGKPCAVVESVMMRDHTVVLCVLKRAGGAMIQEDIASAADNWFDHHLHRTTVGKLLSDLRLLGYVARQGGERSRKGHFITKSGVARLKQHPLLPESH